MMAWDSEGERLDVLWQNVGTALGSYRSMSSRN